MELISQIINDLIDEEKSLNSALLKTKVLASRLQNQELLNWVNNELSGYKSTDKLPDYRREIQNDLKGSFLNGSMKYTNTQIPTIGLDKDFEKKLRFTDFIESISSLENLVSKEESSTLSGTIRAELSSLIEENWQNMGNPYLQLISVYKSMSKSSVIEIITNVRNKLLDFMLELDGKYGDLTEIKDLKMKKEEISSIVNNTIINGDGNVLNTGKNSKITNTSNINKGFKEDLINHLKDIGLSEEDTSEIIEIIDSETPDFQNEKFGVNVNTWIAKMISKTINGSWNVGIGAAGTLLAEAIKKYYGM
ncbi:hypothetical protein G6N05_14850 [Flavobacterium sp. F372]|uniref:AbiTii domain-containing protein n=1 Tax=Flavobacterium bernardetii TaxID=2813823 RepID=A0ABR7J2L1_9FLAO|nr:hypothetical protein [Flavobacterium bernardetii]MBC5836191.1 hypothetical protein [Flavobacterium bernardetii]NHF71391.1 hypothetical protein [Flavobacterium bernardetii]